MGNAPELFWDAEYAIAMALIEQYPEKSPEDVGLQEMAEMIETLPGFSDDPALATERILMDIQIVWYEEAVNL
ncbi:MAG: Fe-S assembly protein IscX [Chloroflexi bacterium]|nr:MAG: Fe-S assembly protein IscX [Chloroflexota bacterium]PIE82310.1 MAG: Fe-S assembly protein IscX [Chloroflexota bacterium]